MFQQMIQTLLIFFHFTIVQTGKQTVSVELNIFVTAFQISEVHFIQGISACCENPELVQCFTWTWTCSYDSTVYAVVFIRHYFGEVYQQETRRRHIT